MWRRDGRLLLREDQLLLLHRADHGAGRDSARCRSCSMSIRRSPRTASKDGLNTITLSYTFYPVREPAPSRWRRATPAKRGETVRRIFEASPERLGAMRRGQSRIGLRCGETCRSRHCRRRDDNGYGARQAPRLPSGRSEPVAGGRRDLGLHHGGRRHHLDAPHRQPRRRRVRRRRHRRALHHGQLVGAT